MFEGRCSTSDDRVDELEKQLDSARTIATDADRKFDEVKFDCLLRNDLFVVWT